MITELRTQIAMFITYIMLHLVHVVHFILNQMQGHKIFTHVLLQYSVLFVQPNIAVAPIMNLDLHTDKHHSHNLI